MRWLRFVLIAALLSGLESLAFAQSCCLSNPRGDPEAARLVGGIQQATVVLLLVPWTLVVGIAFWIKRRSGAGSDDGSA